MRAVSEEQRTGASGSGTDERVAPEATGRADHGNPSIPERAAATAGDLLEAVKPRLRGWLHLGTAPLALAAGIVLVALSPTIPAMVAGAVYALSSVLLFSTSAIYHVGRWSPRAQRTLRRMDHSNIYLIIAGTYTPFAVVALDGGARVGVLATVWTGAIAGVVFRTVWIGAPRALYVTLYIVLGWVAVFFMPQFLDGAGVAACVLVAIGGICYSLGGVVYGLRRPDPSPSWFGFHEVFHTFTLVAYVLQYIAVSLVVYQSG